MVGVRWREPLDAVRVVRRSLRDAWDALVAVAPINLAWVGLGLTVVLLPPATAALFESMHELASGRSPGIRDYIGSVRRRFVGGWAWGLWAAAGLTFAGANIRFDLDPTQPRAWISAAVAVLGILFGVSVLYVWPFVFLQPDGGLGRAIKNSILATLAAPLFAIVLALLLALLIAAGAVLILPLALVIPGLICLVASHAVTDRLRAWSKLPPRPAEVAD
ncbi:MAG TPA: DUF624 domain-containing protein [Candidatus Limnocylindrales bacterium]|jgi:uncharacterized membrane protein YesL|nr:DUF624 domain-containing protein [Candidatus Limnocylindrales bacterium]